MMFTLLFSYTGLLILLVLITLTYTLSHDFFSFLYPTHPQEPSSDTPIQDSLNFRVSPIIVTEEALLMNIEEELETVTKPNPNIYMIIGFYEALYNETLDVHDKNISTLVHYHMKKSYFHEIFRIEKSQATTFDTQLHEILKDIERMPHKQESIRKLYSLFKSPDYKRPHYEMDQEKPSSLFSHH